jgi:predicted MFS family arabinose efflux permease
MKMTGSTVPSPPIAAPALYHAIHSESTPSIGPSAVYFLLTAAVFLILITGGGLPTPLYVLYQRAWHFSPGILTIVFAAYALGLLLVLFLFRRTSDRIGRRTVLLVAVVVAIVSTIVFLFARDVYWLIGARILSGMSVGLAAPAASAGLSEHEPAGDLRRAAGVTAVLTVVGVGVGPFYAGLLAQFAPYPLTLSFWVLLGLLAVAFVAALITREALRTAPLGKITGRGFRVPSEIRRAFLLSAVAAFCGFALAGIFSGLAPSFLSVDLGIREPAISGATVMLMFGSAAIGQVMSRGRPSARLTRWGARIAPLGLISISAAVWTGLAWPFFLGTVLCGLGLGLLLAGGLGMLNQVAPPDRRGEILSGFYVASYLGLSVPVVGIGVTADALGLAVGVVIFSGIIILLLLVLILSRDLSEDPRDSVKPARRPPGEPRTSP